MKNEKYPLHSDESSTHFEFVSVGTKETIKKLIEFQPTVVPDLYNLAFGDIDVETGGIDDFVVSNNGDMDKVLATVADAVYTFFQHYPIAIVYATGSTPARTRLYRMGLTKFYNEIQSTYHLYGRANKQFYTFEIGQAYDGFAVQLKFQ